MSQSAQRSHRSRLQQQPQQEQQQRSHRRRFESLRSQAQAMPGGLQVEQLVTLETNIDDLSPQVMAYTSQKLLDAGALDVWTTPALMKKGRPGMVLHVLCNEPMANPLLTVIFYETSSLGVRVTPCERVSLPRVVESVATQWGFVPVKAAFVQGQLVTATAEYEDCARLAQQYSVPLKEVKQAAENAYRQMEIQQQSQ